mgnify:CR=1 FL=1
MKLLVFHAESFDFRATSAGSPLAAEQPEPPQAEHKDAALAFIQVEPCDEERGTAVIKQALKYFQWFCRKRELQTVILHSFAHLGEQRSSPEFARDLLQALSEQLQQRGYAASQTPFGWSLEWTLSVAGHAYAKTFKQL